MNISVKYVDLTLIQIDALLHPTSSYCFMDSDVGRALQKFGGEVIEQQLSEKSPLHVGQAVSTEAGKLPFKAIIHVAVSEHPGQLTDISEVSDAVNAAVSCAEDLGCRSLAIAGFGEYTTDFSALGAAIKTALEQSDRGIVENILIVTGSQAEQDGLSPLF